MRPPKSPITGSRGPVCRADQQIRSGPDVVGPRALGAELLSIELFDTVLEAQILLVDWREGVQQLLSSLIRLTDDRGPVT